MTYVYDITLNFNNELYDFYEWQKDDILYHIKRINLIKVSSDKYNEIYDNNIVFSNDFLLLIFNKCELYTNTSCESIAYAFLLTDGYRVIALLLDYSGKIIKYSSLLLDEEEDILNLSHRLATVKLDYEIINRRKRVDYKTRLERKVIKFIKKDIRDSYVKKDYSKLKYLYYECFNQKNDNMDEIYKKLLEKLDGEVTDNIYKLYDLIKLSYSHKIV